jgi:hypothetical protein
MASEFYKQCSLEKNGCIHVAWIPEKFAVVNAIVKIKEDNEWNDGFKVIEAYQTKMSHKALQDKASMDRRFWEKDWHHRCGALSV